MFKLRRRTGAVATGSDLPFCAMCQQTIRVDAVTGRCALGHRATTPSAGQFAGEPVVADAAVDVVEDFGTDILPSYDYDSKDPYAHIVYGRSSDYDTADGGPAAWDDAPAEPASRSDAGLDEYASWGEPAEGLSALDVDTEQLPAAEESSVLAPATNELFDELDELDDATHARRRAVGTVGATIAASGAVFAAIAALPL